MWRGPWEVTHVPRCTLKEKPQVPRPRWLVVTAPPRPSWASFGIFLAPKLML